MSCNCIPKQKEPHLVKGGGGKVHFIAIPIKFRIDKTLDKNFKVIKKTLKVTKNIVLLQWMIYKTKPVDCNGNLVNQWGYIYKSLNNKLQ